VPNTLVRALRHFAGPLNVDHEFVSTMSNLAPIICDNGTGFSKIGCVAYTSHRPVC
jgi:hypothetical protein